MRLHGKVALVTGGAHRLGKAIVLGLAEAGASVVVNYFSSALAALDTVAEVQAMGGTGMAVQCDVADAESVRTMVHLIEEKFGGIDVLVNSASRFERTPVPADEFGSWNRVTGVLIDGAFYVSNLVAPLMQRRGSGIIVNILDTSIGQPWPQFAAHTVGKAALMALTRQLALELAPVVRVNGVAPGPVLAQPGADEGKVAAIAGRTLLQRWGNPGDVVQAVKFLIEAEYITGEVIVVDGGESIARPKAWAEQGDGAAQP